MRNWAAFPPKDQGEKIQHKKDIMKMMMDDAKGKLYNQVFPEPKHFQTPYLQKRTGTGMKAFEWNILTSHIARNTVKVAGFWPDVPIINPATLKTKLKPGVNANLLYPWIPRLDGVLLTYTNHIITVEIVNTLTCAAIGELFTKTYFFEAGHPHCPPMHHAQLLYTTENPIIQTMYKNAIPSQLRSFIRLIHIPLSASRIGGKGGSDKDVGTGPPGINKEEV